MNLKQNFVKNYIKNYSSIYQFITPFLTGLIHPFFISNNFFFFWSISKKKHTGKFSSIRPFIQKVAQHIRSIRDPRLKTGWKRIHLCRRVLNEPLHYSIRSTLCNEINESKNKRNNISPVSLKQLNPSKWRIAYFSRSLERTFLFFFLFGKN